MISYAFYLLLDCYLNRTSYFLKNHQKMQKYLVLDIRVSSRDIPETPVENGMM